MHSALIKTASAKLLTGYLVIVSAYFYGVLKVALYSDDYTSMIFTSGMFDHALADLRPGQALMVNLGFATITNNPHEIWRLKCLSLLGLLLLYHLVASRINLVKRSWFIILGIAVGFCLTPFQMYVHWATCWYFTWVGVFGLLSYNVYRKSGWHNKAVGLTTLMISVSTYPIMAFSFIVFCSVINLINKVDARLALNEVFSQIWFAIQATFISVIFSSLLLQLMHIEPSSRVSFVALENIPEKLYWLISRPLVIGLRPFQIGSPNFVTVILSIIPIVLFMTCSLLLFKKRGLKQLSEKFLLIGLLVIVSLAPLAVTSDNQFEFRLIPSYGWLVIMLIFLGLEKVAHLMKRFRAPMNLTAVAFVVVAITVPNLIFFNFFLNPYVTKTQYFTLALVDCQKAGKTASVVVLRPVSNFRTLPNLGVLSQSTDLMSDWVPVANAKVVGESMGLKLGEVTYMSRGGALNQSNCYIDLEGYRQKILGGL